MVPFLDLKAQYRIIGDDVLAAVRRVFENAAFALGPAVQSFEEQFAPYTGCAHAIGINSGTSALHLAFLAAGIGPGDEVIVPAMTFVATASAVDYTGAKPVLADVLPDRHTIDPAAIAACITPRTKAIVPVHLYGRPAEMDPILAIAERHNLLVIEDAAQSHGAEYKGRRCGSMGAMGCFSFYPGKNLGAYGEGGAVTTNRDDFAATIRVLRDWGQRTKGCHALKGYNYRMEGVQGAVLGVKMAHIEAWTEARRGHAARYAAALADLAGITLPAACDAGRHVYHVYAVQSADRDALRDRLQAAGIGVGIHYPLPIHLQPCFAELGYVRGDFPVAEQLAGQELSLPMYAELTEAHIAEVAAALEQAST
jgi:dTDP-4-amino-4,6-dideoxygalactose transaminase